jgi:hypothetical protein
VTSRVFVNHGKALAGDPSGLSKYGLRRRRSDSVNFYRLAGSTGDTDSVSGDRHG